MFGVIGALLTLAFLGDSEDVSAEAEFELEKLLGLSRRSQRYTFFVVFTRDLQMEWELLRHDERFRWQSGYEERLGDLMNAGLVDEHDALFEEMVEEVHWLDAEPDEQLETVIDQMRADFERSTKEQRSDWVDRYDPRYHWIHAWIPPHGGFMKGLSSHRAAQSPFQTAGTLYYTAAVISVAKQPGWETEVDEQLTGWLECLLEDVRMSVSPMVFAVARPGQLAVGFDSKAVHGEFESRGLLGISNSEVWNDQRVAGGSKDSWLRARELQSLKRWLRLVELAKGRWTDPGSWAPQASSV